MTFALLIIGVFIVFGTAAAMGLRNPVHCVLALTVSLTGVAILYLYLGAQFVGLTQIMVYVGAVAILAVFCIMMTYRPGESEPVRFSRQSLAGVLTAASVFAVIAWAILTQPALRGQRDLQPATVSVQQIGDSLMHRYVLPLEIIGLLLTVALIGAVVIAMDRTEDAP
jgi:NADH-quinone oxidoreductase subunit J